MTAMMILLFWCVGVLLIVLQSAILPTFLAPLWIPDILFVYVAFCAYRFSWLAGGLLVFSIAWMTDVVGAVDLGFYPLECIAIFCVFKFFTYNTPIRKVVYQLPLVGVVYLAWQLSTYMVYTFFNFPHPPSLYGNELFLETLLLLTASLPSFALLSKVADWIEQKKMWMKPPRRRPPKRRE